MADELVERLNREAPLLYSMAKNVADALRSLGKTPREGTEQLGYILRIAAARIQSDAAEIASLKAQVAEARAKAVADVAAWLRDSGGIVAGKTRRMCAGCTPTRDCRPR